MTNIYMKCFYKFFFSITLWSTAFYAHSGAWTQNKGSALNIATGQYYQSNNYWTSGGHLRSSPIYKKGYGSNYFEFGITDKLTFGGYFSGLNSYTQAGGTQGGGNDNLILGRYQLWKNDQYVISTQLYFDALGHGAKLNIPPQNGRFNSSEALWIGTSGTSKEKKVNWFFDGGIAYIQRYGPGDQIQVILESGWKFNQDRLWIFVQNYNTVGLAYPQKGSFNLFTIAPSVLVWPTKYLGLQLGVTQDFYGQNVGEGTGPFVALWLTV